MSEICSCSDSYVVWLQRLDYVAVTDALTLESGLDYGNSVNGSTGGLRFRLTEGRTPLH
jgi:hypothetical protein